jgi:hypothetical protein
LALWAAVLIAIYRKALSTWPTHHYFRRALVFAAPFAPGLVGGLDMMMPVPASVGIGLRFAFWPNDTSDLDTGNIVSLFVTVLLLYFVGRGRVHPGK